MELKLATATSQDVNMAQSQHYNLEAMISGAISRMSMQGKRVLADRISAYCAECEKEAK